MRRKESVCQVMNMLIDMLIKLDREDIIWLLKSFNLELDMTDSHGITRNIF